MGCSARLRLAWHCIARPARINLAHDSLGFADCVLGYFGLQSGALSIFQPDSPRSERIVAQMHSVRLRSSSIGKLLQLDWVIEETGEK
jgi:hypothetical protein